MFSTCNTACVDTSTLSKADICNVYQRNEVVVRLLTSKCDFDLPVGDYDSSALADAVTDAIADGKIGATMELANVEWADPTTATKQYRSRCRPASTINTGRVLNARDYNAYDVNAAGASTPYNDRIIYADEIQSPSTRVIGYVTCDGKIYLFLNDKGGFMSYSIHHFIGYDNEVDGQSIEFKNYVISFVGDPLKLRTPYLDIVAAGAVADLGWLFNNVK